MVINVQKYVTKNAEIVKLMLLNNYNVVINKLSFVLKNKMKLYAIALVKDKNNVVITAKIHMENVVMNVLYLIALLKYKNKMKIVNIIMKYLVFKII